MTQVVIDANVLAHCGNPAEMRCEHSLRLINLLLSGTQDLCVDPGFNLIEARNRSRIGSEYLNHLTFGSPGFSFVAHLAQSGRVKPIKPSNDSNVSRKINQRLTDKTDRVYLKVAVVTIDKLFVSHDFTDLPTDKRTYFFAEIGVQIVDADCCAQSMQAAS